jgi:hypothetical protein
VCEWETPTLLRPLKRDNFGHCSDSGQLFMTDRTVSPTPSPEDGNKFSFRTSCSLERRTLDEAPKPSNSECYTNHHKSPLGSTDAEVLKQINVAMQSSGFSKQVNLSVIWQLSDHTLLPIVIFSCHAETSRFPHFLDRRLTDGDKVVSLTRPLPPGRFLVLISVRDWIDPRAIMRLEGLNKLKKSTSSGL